MFTLHWKSSLKYVFLSFLFHYTVILWFWEASQKLNNSLHTNHHSLIRSFVVISFVTVYPSLQTLYLLKCQQIRQYFIMHPLMVVPASEIARRIQKFASLDTGLSRERYSLLEVLLSPGYLNLIMKRPSTKGLKRG